MLFWLFCIKCEFGIRFHIREQKNIDYMKLFSPFLKVPPRMEKYSLDFCKKAKIETKFDGLTTGGKILIDIKTEAQKSKNVSFFHFFQNVSESTSQKLNNLMLYMSN